jgi:hypothetical protein
MPWPLLLPFVSAAAILGFVSILFVLFTAIAGIAGKFGPIGNWIANNIIKFQHGITHALGQMFAGIDHYIAAHIHGLARLIEQAVGEVKSHARLLAELSAVVVPIGHAIIAVAHLGHNLTRVFRGIEHGVRDLRRLWHGIEHRVHRLEREITKGIGHDLRIHVKALERELGHVEGQVIPAIRGEVATAEHAIDHLYEWAKGKASLIGVGTFAFAVAAVLEALGFGGIKCPSFGNLFNKRGCGLWNLLDDLLGLAVSALALENICTLLPLLETAFGEVVGPVTTLLTGVSLGGCETPPSGWAELSVAAGPLPPPQTLGKLAA